MGLLDWLLSGQGLGIRELARRLGVEEQRLRQIKPVYRAFTVPKRSGGARQILAPEPDRYADDITISLADDENGKLHFVRRSIRRIVESHSYRLHTRKKLSIRRRHQRQSVTGLVVNQCVQLPRETRRWLRAVEHRTRQSQRSRLENYEPLGGQPPKEPTLMPAQLKGWRAFQAMVERQAKE